MFSFSIFLSQYNLVKLKLVHSERSTNLLSFFFRGQMKSMGGEVQKCAKLRSRSQDAALGGVRGNVVATVGVVAGVVFVDVVSRLHVLDGAHELLEDGQHLPPTPRAALSVATAPVGPHQRRYVRTQFYIRRSCNKENTEATFLHPTINSETLIVTIFRVQNGSTMWLSNLCNNAMYLFSTPMFKLTSFARILFITS